MAGAERGIVAQIIALRAEEARKKEAEEARKLQEAEEKRRKTEDEIQRKATGLRESFLTLKPVIEPFLQEIADEYRDERGQALSHPKVKTFEPIISDKDSRSGRVGLIWGTPIARIEDAHGKEISLITSEPFDIYTRAKFQLDSNTKLTRRQRELQEDLRRMYGAREVKVSGFNTIVFVADIDELYEREGFRPLLQLRGTDIPLTRIQAWYDNTRITDLTTIAPILTKALDHPTNRGTVTTSLAEFISSGTKIRSIVPFV